MLMTSPLAKGLFQKAIAESGAAINPTMPTLADGRTRRRAVSGRIEGAYGRGCDQVHARVVGRRAFESVAEPRSHTSLRLSVRALMVG